MCEHRFSTKQFPAPSYGDAEKNNDESLFTFSVATKQRATQRTADDSLDCQMRTVLEQVASRKRRFPQKALHSQIDAPRLAQCGANYVHVLTAINTVETRYSSILQDRSSPFCGRESVVRTSDSRGTGTMHRTYPCARVCAIGRTSRTFPRGLCSNDVRAIVFFVPNVLVSFVVCRRFPFLVYVISLLLFLFPLSRSSAMNRVKS